MLLIKVCLRVFHAEHYVVHYICIHGVLHNHESFFQKVKSCISPKLRLKSIFLFYKDRLEI